MTRQTTTHREDPGRFLPAELSTAADGVRPVDLADRALRTAGRSRRNRWIGAGAGAVALATAVAVAVPVALNGRDQELTPAAEGRSHVVGVYTTGLGEKAQAHVLDPETSRYRVLPPRWSVMPTSDGRRVAVLDFSKIPWSSPMSAPPGTGVRIGVLDPTTGDVEWFTEIGYVGAVAWDAEDRRLLATDMSRTAEDRERLYTIDMRTGQATWVYVDPRGGYRIGGILPGPEPGGFAIKTAESGSRPLPDPPAVVNSPYKGEGYSLYRADGTLIRRVLAPAGTYADGIVSPSGDRMAATFQPPLRTGALGSQNVDGPVDEVRVLSWPEMSEVKRLTVPTPDDELARATPWYLLGWRGDDAVVVGRWWDNECRIGEIGLDGRWRQLTVQRGVIACELALVSADGMSAAARKRAF